MYTLVNPGISTLPTRCRDSLTSTIEFRISILCIDVYIIRTWVVNNKLLYNIDINSNSKNVFFLDWEPTTMISFLIRTDHAGLWIVEVIFSSGIYFTVGQRTGKTSFSS